MPSGALLRDAPKKAFVTDIAKCIGCHSCQIVRKDEHVTNDWTPIAKPQPETGQFWIELTERVRGTVPKVKVAYRRISQITHGDLAKDFAGLDTADWDIDLGDIPLE